MSEVRHKFSITLDAGDLARVEAVRRQERRNRQNTIEILILEALAAREARKGRTHAP